jgi:hypothetical protein
MGREGIRHLTLISHTRKRDTILLNGSLFLCSQLKMGNNIKAISHFTKKLFNFFAIRFTVRCVI